MIEETQAAAVNEAPRPRGTPLGLTRPEWALLLVLAAVQVTHIIDFVIIMPLGPEFKSALQITTAQFGWIVSAYAFSACVTGLLAAWCIDRFDRKTALLVLYTGFTVGTLLCAVAPSYPFLVVARTVAGGFAGVVAADVLAIVGDVFPDVRRGTAMGVVMTAFSVASIIGVPAGIFLANHFGWRMPFGVLGLLSVPVLILAWEILPPLRGHLERGAGPAASVGRSLAEPIHQCAYALTTALVLSTFTIFPYLSIYLVYNVGRHKEELPYIWLFGGVATLVTMPLFGRISDRYGKLLVFRVLALATVIPVLLTTNLPPSSLAVTLSVTTLFMILSSGRMVPAMAMITACSLPAYRGSFLSINASVQQLAAGVAPLLAALVLGTVEEDAQAPLVGFPRVGLVAVAFMVASVLLAGRLRPATAPVAEGPGELLPAGAAVESLHA